MSSERVSCQAKLNKACAASECQKRLLSIVIYVTRLHCPQKLINKEENEEERVTEAKRQRYLGTHSEDMQVHWKCSKRLNRVLVAALPRKWSHFGGGTALYKFNWSPHTYTFDTARVQPHLHSIKATAFVVGCGDWDDDDTQHFGARSHGATAATNAFCLANDQK